jgi:hypothetical protein
MIEWIKVPGSGRRFWMAIPRALSTKVAVCAESMDQPTNLREKAFLRAQWPDTFDGGFRLSGHGDEVEVFYSLDAEYAPGHPNAPHERIAAVMLGAIADVLLATGFGFTAPSDDNITDTNRRGPVLLVHSRTTERS